MHSSESAFCKCCGIKLRLQLGAANWGSWSPCPVVHEMSLCLGLPHPERKDGNNFLSHRQIVNLLIFVKYLQMLRGKVFSRGSGIIYLGDCQHHTCVHLTSCFFHLLHSLKEFRNLLESTLETRNGFCCSQPIWLEYLKLPLATAGLGGSSARLKRGSYRSCNRFEGGHGADYHAGFFNHLRKTILLVCIKYLSGPWMWETDIFVVVVAFSKGKCILKHTLLYGTHQLFASAAAHPPRQEAASPHHHPIPTAPPASHCLKRSAAGPAGCSPGQNSAGACSEGWRCFRQGVP